MKTAGFLFTMVIIAMVSMILAVSCQKDVTTNGNAPEGKQSVAVYLNDDPDVNFTKVLIDLRAVEVKIDSVGRRSDDDYDDDKDDDDDHHGRDKYGKWDTLNVKAGIYDLLRLRNGIDTLIANGFVIKGKVIKVRLTLGSNNSVWTDSNKSFPLPMCDKNSPYLYVRIKSNSIDTVPGGGIRINLDFDVSKSINSKRSGTEFCLRPVLKAYSHGNCGEIEGKVLPAAAKARVMIFNAKDTAFAIPDYDDDGEYKVKGLNPGTYSILFDGIVPYKDTTIQNIVVRKNEDTKVPTVTLDK
jgi:hypothetical protein